MPKLAHASAAAAARIRARIVAGDYPPGTRLVERTLAAELDLSRVPVREALRALVAEGFAAERSTGGVAVRGYTRAELLDLLDANAALERVLVTRLAGDPDAAAAFDDVLAATARALAEGRTADAIAENARFHAVLVDAAYAPAVHELLSVIRPRLSWLLQMHDDPALLHAEHVEIAAAVRAGDAARAARLVEAHVTTGRQALALADKQVEEGAG